MNIEDLVDASDRLGVKEFWVKESLSPQNGLPWYRVSTEEAKHFTTARACVVSQDGTVFRTTGGSAEQALRLAIRRAAAYRIALEVLP